MKTLKLDLESLGVETFATVPEPSEAELAPMAISRRSCIEQCTPTCVP